MQTVKYFNLVADDDIETVKYFDLVADEDNERFKWLLGYAVVYSYTHSFVGTTYSFVGTCCTAHPMSAVSVR